MHVTDLCTPNITYIFSVLNVCTPWTVSLLIVISVLDLCTPNIVICLQAMYIASGSSTVKIISFEVMRM